MELDSGATATVVMKEFVPQALFPGNSLTVVAFDSRKLPLPTARVTI